MPSQPWREARLPILVAIVVALFASFVLVRAHQPPGTFSKYALIASAPVDAGRADDVSPLYLALTRMFLPLGSHAILVAQNLAHALTAGLLALAAHVLAGRRAAFISGILAALHAPLMVAAGTHEPEAALQLMLAAAIAAGILARADAAARFAPAWGFAAGIALGAATLLRPQHLLLIPAWCCWLALVPRARRKLVVLLAPFAGALLVLAPVVAPRLVSGVPSTMNPGVVLYEGNWPGASGLARVAPPLVRELERAHPEAADYGHVAYRRLASFALGADVDAGASNRWWLGLLGEGLKERPGEAMARGLRKLVHAIAPHEVHDLRSMEDLGRRARAFLPWGFFVLAGGLAWIPLARNERLVELLGPLCVAALAVGIQVAFYASARQRLPLATAALVIVPVLLDDVFRQSLRVALRRSLVMGLALAVSLMLAFATGRDALVDQAQWDSAGARPAAGLGESLAGIADGRLLRPSSERALIRGLIDDIDAVAAGKPAPPRLQELRGQGIDLTIDDLTVLVPEYWLATATASPAQALELALEALAIRPGDPRVVARAHARSEARADHADVDASRPAGCDPASWLWLVAREAGDARIAEPLREDFPELF